MTLGSNDTPPAGDTVWLRLSEAEANYMTSLLVKFPYEVAAPIIQILGHRLMEARDGST